MPYLVFEKFGQAKPIPGKSSKSIKFRRYYLSTTFSDDDFKKGDGALGGMTDDGTFDTNTYNPAQYFTSTNLGATTLTEGTTPTEKGIASEDIYATLVQYGDRVEISDVIMDTHEDPVLQEATDILGEQAAFAIEMVRYNILKGGSNVAYANGVAARASIVDIIKLNDLRKISRKFKRNLAKPITSVVKSDVRYGTQAIAPAFIAVCHPDCEADIRGLSGFVSAENYGSTTPFDGEIGKVEDFRFISSTVMEPVADSGGTAVTNSLVYTTANTACDVYPILIFARDAYGIVPLKGKNSLTPMVVNAKPSDSDPLAQRNHVGWKTYQTCIILNDFNMCRLEVGVSAL